MVSGDVVARTYATRVAHPKHSVHGIDVEAEPPLILSRDRELQGLVTELWLTVYTMYPWHSAERILVCVGQLGDVATFAE